jgi:hypothetical protein
MKRQGTGITDWPDSFFWLTKDSLNYSDVAPVRLSLIAYCVFHYHLHFLYIVLLY